MIREWVADQGLLAAPAFALILFLAVFIGVLVWIYRPGSSQVYAREARLPLDDEPTDWATDDAAGSPARARRHGTNAG